ncbi:MAG: O-antigen ligase family protein [Desulfobacterota bacterium]|nr:O-antigen ligase family protein [Thermodesulfobacteriota bacterium]
MKPACRTIPEHVELLGLCALAFVLPNLESPKYFALALLAGGAWVRWLSRKPLEWKKLDSLEWLLIALWGISLASTVANWPLPNGTKGLRAQTLMLLLFWIMYRRQHEAGPMRWFLSALVAGVVIGLPWGFWEWQTGIRSEFEFHSAGVVTQSAIYLGITILVMIGVLLDRVSGFGHRVKASISLCLLLSLAGLTLMGSRGAILGVLLTVLALAPLLLRHKKFWMAAAASLLFMALIATGVLLATTSYSLERRLTHLFSNVGPNGLKLDERDQNDLFRLDHWKVGYAQATQGGHWLLGIGPANFKSIQVDTLRFNTPLATYPSIWKKPHHAHNLFLTKWAEEGLLGLLAFLLFLGCMLWGLIRHRPRNGQWNWSWVAGLGALIVPVVAGSFNCSFANEFAWLSMILMGHAMAVLRHGRDSNPPLPI